MYHGLTLAVTFGNLDVEIESDSLVGVDLIAGPMNTSHSLIGLT